MQSKPLSHSLSDYGSPSAEGGRSLAVFPGQFCILSNPPHLTLPSSRGKPLCNGLVLVGPGSHQAWLPGREMGFVLLGRGASLGGSQPTSLTLPLQVVSLCVRPALCKCDNEGVQFAVLTDKTGELSGRVPWEGKCQVLLLLPHFPCRCYPHPA